jgi:hypothetical protein
MPTSEELRSTLETLHASMSDAGLFSGVMEAYWYRIWDYLVAELLPEMAEE